MHVAIYGTGAVGSRAARQLVSSGNTIETMSLIDNDLSVAQEVAASIGSPADATTISALRLETRIERFHEICENTDVVVLTASDDHVELAQTALRAGCHVISVSDDLDTVRKLLDMDDMARDVERNIVVGAGFAPGLTCLLARHAAAQLDVVDEIHIAKFGTGGPACARQHHRALRSDGIEWRNQQWEERRGGTGRELCWFPDPVGGLDCFQAALPDPLLLLPAFPGLVRCAARVSATRRDIGTKWLPMLRRPHPEGLIGAVRVEVRGWRGTVRDAVVLGALDRPAVAAGTVAAVATEIAVRGEFQRSGSGGLAGLLHDTLPVLKNLADRGLRAAVFEGMKTHA